MTKVNMIQEIQYQEAALWYDLRAYEAKNAPDNGNWCQQVLWETHDEDYREKLGAWYALISLMEILGIEKDLTLSAHKEAGVLSNDLFIRRQAAKGIHYDENGNRI